MFARPLFLRGELEREEELLVEVVACYGGSIIDVAHVRDRYVIGEGRDVDLTATGAGLPDAEGSAIVRADELGGFWLEFTAKMRGAVCVGGVTERFEALARAGARPIGGHLQVPLPRGARAWIERGDLRLLLRSVPAETLVLERAPRDRLLWACTLTSAATGLALLALMAMLPPQLLALDAARLQVLEPTAYALADHVEPEQPEILHRHRARAGVPTDAQAHPGDDPDEPETGLARSPERHGSAGPQGQAGSEGSERERDEPRWPAPREQPRRFPHPDDALEFGSSGGVLSALAGPYMEAFAAASPGAFRPEIDDRGLWESMTALDDAAGEAYGVGGLGLVGTGRGVGGMGEGVIGLGSRGLIGRGGGQPDHTHGCHGCPDRRRKRREWIPRLHIGEAEATHDYAITSVRKVLRRHTDELVSCYADALGRDPTLRGSVTMGFVITASGRVGLAAADVDTLDDRELERCLALSIQRWRFPAPAGGTMVMVEQTFEFDSRRGGL